MKKIIVGIIVIVSIFLIYTLLEDNKVYYVSISDRTSLAADIEYGYKNHIKEYLDENNKLEKYIDIYDPDVRITDIIRDIKENKKCENKTFKNILIKADLITLSLGYNDLISKIDKYNNYDMHKYIDTYLNDLEELFTLLRMYDKEKIIMIGYYNPYSSSYNNMINYINNKVENLCLKYKIDFIDIFDMKEYIDNNYIIIEGQHIIFDRIREYIDRK